uniref:AlNc14C56G4249 protein n=1 Tax=Albugo laibachii Nc14 TaxID=890382 RepID=F0WC66_9STRA|nr:AlNc14C56G4249 [Albugo laibachii Nc14]|eukprot:CCA18779.1 AlNc14C56G4249 [Albugo laibachii Nc14]
MKATLFSSPVVLLLSAVSLNMEGKVLVLSLNRDEQSRSEIFAASSPVTNKLCGTAKEDFEDIVHDRAKRQLVNCKDRHIETLASVRVLAPEREYDEVTFQLSPKKEKKEKNTLIRPPAQMRTTTQMLPLHQMLLTNLPAQGQVLSHVPFYKQVAHPSHPTAHRGRIENRDHYSALNDGTSSVPKHSLASARHTERSNLVTTDLSLRTGPDQEANEQSTHLPAQAYVKGVQLGEIDVQTGKSLSRRENMLGPNEILHQLRPQPEFARVPHFVPYNPSQRTSHGQTTRNPSFPGTAIGGEITSAGPIHHKPHGKEIDQTNSYAHITAGPSVKSHPSHLNAPDERVESSQTSVTHPAANDKRHHLVPFYSFLSIKKTKKLI